MEKEFSISDVLNTFKRKRQTIKKGALFFSALCLSYALITPLQYQVEGTFREKGKTAQGLSSSSVMSMLLTGGGTSNNQEAIVTLKSRRLLEPLIKKNGLQARFKSSNRLVSVPLAIWDKIRLEWGLLIREKGPLVKDRPVPFFISSVDYPSEYPEKFTLRFTSDSTYELINGDGGVAASGIVGEPLQTPSFSMTLNSYGTESLIHKSYLLYFDSMQVSVDRLRSSLKVTSEKTDPTLVYIKYFNRDRSLAASVLNGLMEEYQIFLKKEQQLISKEQLKYLQKRQEEVTLNLESMMELYSDNLKTELNSIGFPETAKAMEFLAKWQQKSKDQLLSIELDAMRIKKAQEEKAPFLNDTGEIFSQIRSLKLEQDALELALRLSPFSNPESLKQEFEKQNIQLAVVRQGLEDIAVIEKAVLEHKPISKELSLIQNDRYLANLWADRLLDLEKNCPVDRQACQEQYLQYLSHLNHLFTVQRKTLEDRLKYQQSPNEFDGITIRTANELYMTYSKNLSEIQTRILQLTHTLKQMDEPDFEISSLGFVLNDEVSRMLIAKASELVLASHEDSNRTAKEQQRLRRELDTQQKFLKVHVAQTIDLLNIHQDLWKKKIFDLQNTLLDLTRQHVTLLENQMEDHANLKLSHLQSEKELIGYHQREIQHEMSKLPKQWIEEKKIDYAVKMHEKIVEEITKLVESKNISNNLEIIQSAPLDEANLPIHPKSPGLILMSVLGALLGTLLTTSTLFVKGLRNGFQISKENIEFRGGFVAGSIDAISNPKLPSCQTLSCARVLLSRLQSSTPGLIVGEKSVQLASVLLALLEKRGERGLLIDLVFDQISRPGLVAYLRGESSFPLIQEKESFDLIETGEISRFGEEIVFQEKFNELLIELKKKYRWIILSSPKQPSSSEAKILARHFEQTIVIVSDESIEEMEDYLKTGDQTSFVIYKGLL